MEVLLHTVTTVVVLVGLLWVLDSIYLFEEEYISIVERLLLVLLVFSSTTLVVYISNSLSVSFLSTMKTVRW